MVLNRPMRLALAQHRTAVHQALLAILVLAALLVSVLAMHTAGMQHSEADAAGGAAPAVAASGATGSTAIGSTATAHQHSEAAGAQVSVDAAPVSRMFLGCDERCVEECLVMALSCMLLFIVLTLLVVGRSRARLRALLAHAAGPMPATPRSRTHVYWPSLTELSISRT